METALNSILDELQKCISNPFVTTEQVQSAIFDLPVVTESMLFDDQATELFKPLNTFKPTVEPISEASVKYVPIDFRNYLLRDSFLVYFSNHRSELVKYLKQTNLQEINDLTIKYTGKDLNTLYLHISQESALQIPPQNTKMIKILDKLIKKRNKPQLQYNWYQKYILEKTLQKIQPEREETNPVSSGYDLSSFKDGLIIKNEKSDIVSKLEKLSFESNDEENEKVKYYANFLRHHFSLRGISNIDVAQRRINQRVISRNSIFVFRKEFETPLYHALHEMMESQSIESIENYKYYLGLYTDRKEIVGKPQKLTKIEIKEYSWERVVKSIIISLKVYKKDELKRISLFSRLMEKDWNLSELGEIVRQEKIGKRNRIETVEKPGIPYILMHQTNAEGEQRITKYFCRDRLTHSDIREFVKHELLYLNENFHF
jgi:hypothetical protein